MADEGPLEPKLLIIQKVFNETFKRAFEVKRRELLAEGIPSSETHCSSESEGALIPRDRSNVAEFVRKFWMRVN